MTRLQMRTMLRARLNETVAHQWQDATLDLYLNMGLKFLHREVQKVHREAVVYTAVQDTVADQYDYPKPVNCQSDLYVYLKGSATGSYVPIWRVAYYRMLETDANQARNALEDTCYAVKGRFIVIWPTPTVGVVEGLKLAYVPILGMAVDDEVPDLVEELHEGIVYRAEMLSMGELTLDAPVAEKELKILVDSIPTYYQKSGQPDQYDQGEVTKWGVE